MTAKSSAEWLDLAARWQQASDLMATVPANDSRYATAQDRVLAYRKNSESALEEAKRQQSASPATVSASETPPDSSATQQ
jgi:putative SOS response-associated peptidase YedK